MANTALLRRLHMPRDFAGGRTAVVASLAVRVCRSVGISSRRPGRKGLVTSITLLIRSDMLRRFSGCR